MRWLCPGRALFMTAALGLSGNGFADESTEVLKAEIEALKARIEVLEQRRPIKEQLLNTATIGSEQVSEKKASRESPKRDIKVGGALRFNLLYQEDADASVGKRGESGLDVFRFNVDGQRDHLLISAEYRFYPYMSVLHHGWVGYEFEDASQLQLGITQVPFGILPYASHNAWAGVPYYVGLADDYDMGIKYQRERGPWSMHFAFFKNEEFNDATNLDRYGFDLVRVGEQQNEEVNQLNARLAYTFGETTACETQLGASVEAGQMYNTLSEERGDRWAGAAHLDNRCGRWSLQLQSAQYRYSAADPAGVDDSVVRVGAFAGSYDIDSDARVWVANLAYNLPVSWPLLDSVTCYNDYSRLDKSIAGATDSEINTTGCAIGSGPLFTYIDYILAKNMPYFGQGSLADGGEDDWQGRFNINIGYYW